MEAQSRETRSAIVQLWRSLALDQPRTGQDRLFREIDRFDRCGSAVRSVYGCTRCGAEFGVPISCNSRICDRCGRRLYVRLFERLESFLRPYARRSPNTYSLKFLTLTFAASRFNGYPTSEDLSRCRKEAALMLRLFFGKCKARLTETGKLAVDYRKPLGRGAFAVVEVGGSGLIHYHALVYGPIIKHNDLREAWQKITADSSIVDIREVKGRVIERRGHKIKKSAAACAVDYVLKYVTKPPANQTLDQLPKYALMLKGSRRFTSLGIFYGQVSTRSQRRGRFCCLFDGARLKFSGESADGSALNGRWPLVDYFSSLKYVDIEAGLWLRSWLRGVNLTPV